MRMIPQRKNITAIDGAGAGIAVALTLIVVFGVWFPLNIQERKIAASRQTAAREQQRLAGIITAVRALKLELKNREDQIAASPLHILPPESVNQRLSDLASLSSECALNVDEMKPGEAIQSPHFLIVPLHMAGHGGYGNCVTFVHFLHERLPDVEVVSFKLAGTPDQPATPSTFDFSLEWFASARGTSPEIPHVTTAELP